MKSYTYFVVKYFVDGDPRPKYVNSDTPDVKALIKCYPEIDPQKSQVMTITVTNDIGNNGKCEIVDFDGKKYMTSDKGTAIVLHKFDNGQVDLLI